MPDHSTHLLPITSRPFRASILKRPPKRVRITLPDNFIKKSGSIKNHKKLNTKRPGIPSELKKAIAIFYSQGN